MLFLVFDYSFIQKYYRNPNVSIFRNHGNIYTIHILKIQGLMTIL